MDWQRLIIRRLVGSNRPIYVSFLLAAAAALLVFDNRVQIVASAAVSLASIIAVLFVVQKLTPPRVRQFLLANNYLLFIIIMSVWLMAIWLISGRDGKNGQRILGEIFIFWLPLFALFNLKELRQTSWFFVALVAGGLFFRALGPTIASYPIWPYENLDLDHRPIPDPSTNEDGVKPPAPASSYRPGDFTIVFLGGSYAAGDELSDAERPFPTLVETALRERFPQKNIKIVNFGWSSSSPVLQLRQLRDIGAKYHPRLVVQALGMSDFGNDVHYADELAKISGGKLSVWQALQMRLLGTIDYLRWAREKLPERFHRAFQPPAPAHRYFFLFDPPETAAPLFEVSWTMIVKTSEFARSLGAKYAVFVLPQSQQYDVQVHSPDPFNEFPVDSPHLLAPFAFFQEKAATASFPIHSLLDDFRHAGVSPTSFPDNGDYTQAGHRIAADAMFKCLIADGFFDPTQ